MLGAEQVKRASKFAKSRYYLSPADENFKKMGAMLLGDFLAVLDDNGKLLFCHISRMMEGCKTDE